MGNPLTGDYEAVVQIAVRQVNGLLGTIHQNAATPDAPPLKLAHSAILHIGDPLRRPEEVEAFGYWLTEYRGGAGRGLDRTQLAATAPPGATPMLSDAFVGLDQKWEIVPLPNVVRGLARLQVSSVTITVPDGSASEVILHARVRAHYYPDPGTAEMPEPIHGDVQAALNVRKVLSDTGTRLLIQPSSHDSIQFVAMPGTGLNTADDNKIAIEVGKFFAERLTPVDLPTDFPFADFKGLGAGPAQVIALPLQLSGAALHADGLRSLTRSFIGSSGFAFALSQEYVGGLINIEAIRGAVESRQLVFRVSLGFLGSISATYRLHFSRGPTLTFKNGGIEISGRVEAETSSLAPNGFVSFKQLITLALDTSAQTVSLERAGEPDVDESWFIPHDTAVNIVKSEIDGALTANEILLRREFTDAKSMLVNGLETFDTSATVLCTAFEITPDGIIVRGEIGSGVRRAPVVDIAQTHGGKAFTAFRSWIPAGRIDRFIWSWGERSARDIDLPWSVRRSFMDDHRFILPSPTKAIRQICLQIEGTQIMPDGHEVGIASTTTCQVQEPEFAIYLPSWWEPLTLPIWRPDVSDTMTLRGAITGHISVQPDVPGKESFSQNALVYFADWRSKKPLDKLSVALSRVRNSAELMVIVVLPAGTFDSSRREFESKLPSARKRMGTPLQFTEDDEGGWTHMFAVAKTPSVYLINARREFVWKHEGEPDPAVLAAALDQHLVPTPEPRFGPLRLTVSPGDSAPLWSTPVRLHRPRGRNVLLNFWQSWSAPCLTELGRLQRLHKADRETPFIVAFHGGKNSNALDEIRKHLGLSFPLVQDSQQRIGRRYGVRCWPTTIMIDAEGRVEHVQFGIGHDAVSSDPMGGSTTSKRGGAKAVRTGKGGGKGAKTKSARRTRTLTRK